MLIKADIAKENRSRAAMAFAAVLVAGAFLPVALNNVSTLTTGAARPGIQAAAQGQGARREIARGQSPRQQVTPT